MLQLLRAPRWAPPDAPERQVPATLPGCLLVYLAAQGSWVDRERLAALFWPDASGSDALHHLRVNLHRVRGVLKGWGQAEALRAERNRLHLDLPTDVATLRRVLGEPGAASLLAWRPRHWLQGLRIAGFSQFWDWADRQGEQWRDSWAAAADRVLQDALMQGRVEGAAALFDAWWTDEGNDAPGTTPARPLRALQALAALPPAELPAASRALWQQLQARLQAPGATSATATPRPLAGRNEEMAALLASRAAATVVSGEPGAGKTRLLTAAHPGAPVLHGREGQGGVPFGPLLEWLRQQPAARLAALCQRDTVAAYRLDLARLLPELAPGEALPPLDLHTAKVRLLEGLARLFDAQGGMLLADDLQWFDAASLEWLAFLAHRGRPRWCASARLHETTAAARQVLDALRVAQLLEEQSLQPLGPRALAEACRSRWPLQAWDDDTLARLHRSSGGNPFVLGELVNAGAAALSDAPMALPRRVQQLVQRRLQTLGTGARHLVEAASVLVHPVPLAVLRSVADPMDDAGFVRACDEALLAELLHDEGAGLLCRHDLIREAAVAGLGLPRRLVLHRRAALALADVAGAEPLDVAAHWQAAQEPQTALAWMLRGAQQQRERGRFAEARGLWQRVAAESLDAAQALRARLALAECDLFDNLRQGRAGLEAVLEDASAVADAAQRDEIEGQALAGLIDNAVFAGDLPRAIALAPRLRDRLPRLRAHGRQQACEVLIELAMREPDIDAAWSLLAQMRRQAPQHPSVLSFEAQIHWFAGQAAAARDALRALLARYPEHRRGITIENDLAVMLHALGELGEAEEMARRSLESWRGVAHTETLSLLVLGSVLTSAGRYTEARQALLQAHTLARDQASAGFEAEAQVRLARLLWQCGRFGEAQAALDAAAPLLAASTEPLRASQYLGMQVLVACARGMPPPAHALDRLRALAATSAHPWVHVRLLRSESALALAGGDGAAAMELTQRLSAVAQSGGLLEALAEAQLLCGQALAASPDDTRSAARHWVLQAQALAATQGFADVTWRAGRALDALDSGGAESPATTAALGRLGGDDASGLFDAACAAVRDCRRTDADDRPDPR